MATITQRVIPDNAREMTRPNTNAVAYVYERNGKPCAIGYAGGKKKPAFSYWYKTEERRDEDVKQFLDKHEEKALEKIRYREERKNFATTLVIGDVLYGSWGWEQTNVEFFEVIHVKSKNTVIVRPLCKKKTYIADMSGEAVPVPGKYSGDAQTVRVGPGEHCNPSLSFMKVLVGKWDGEPKYFSEYA